MFLTATLRPLDCVVAHCIYFDVDLCVLFSVRCVVCGNFVCGNLGLVPHCLNVLCVCGCLRVVVCGLLFCVW